MEKMENEGRNKLRIGIDFGGVLADDSLYEKGSTKSEMSMPGCKEALKLLRKEGHYLVLVSFCGKNRAETNRKNLPLDEYFDEVFFVKNRDHKNLICKAKALDVLIDDRQDILDTLDSCYGILFGKKPTFQDKYRAENWTETLKVLGSIKPLNSEPDQSIDIYRLIHK